MKLFMLKQQAHCRAEWRVRVLHSAWVHVMCYSLDRQIVGRGERIVNVVEKVVYGTVCRSAVMVDDPLAQDRAPITKTNALPLLSSCTVTLDMPVPKGIPSGPNQKRLEGAQRAKSPFDLMVTNRSACVDGNST